MLFHKCRIDLSDSAKRDFRNILSYTLRTWGERQFIAYKNLLDSAFNTLSINPTAGCLSRKSAARVFSVGRHMIYYRLEHDVVYIIRILHDRMQVARHLDEQV